MGRDCETIYERVMQHMEEKRYDEAWVIGRDLLPLLSEEQRDVRLQLYALLGQCPGHALVEDEQERVRGLVEEVMLDTQAGPEERVYAHLLYSTLGPPGHQGEGNTFVRGKLPTEVREMQGLQAAQLLLGRGSRNREHQLAALNLVCQTSLDDVEISSHCEALLLSGEERHITDACCGIPPSFHATTRCAYLDRALAIVEDCGRRANLLGQKLPILVMMLGNLPEERDWEDEELFDYIYGGIPETYATLQLTGTAVQRAWSHVHMAQYGFLLGEALMVETHLAVAGDMARALGDVDIADHIKRMWECIECSDDDGEDEDEEAWKKT